MSRPSSICSENSYIHEFSDINLINDNESTLGRRDSLRYPASSPFPQAIDINQAGYNNYAGANGGTGMPAYGQPGMNYSSGASDSSSASQVQLQQQQMYTELYQSQQMPHVSAYAAAGVPVDPRRPQHYHSTMALASSETYGQQGNNGQQPRSLTPLHASQSFYETMNPVGGQGAATGGQFAFNQSYGPSSYQDPSVAYRRQDLSRSYRDVSAIGAGATPIMSTLPFGHSSLANANGPSSLPFPGARYGPQVQGANYAALQDWMMKYQQWWQYMNNRRLEQMRRADPDRHRRTPPLFAHRHSRVCFGPTNQLLVIQASNVVIQQLDPGLIDVGETVLVSTWPGPLIKGESDKADVLEYIRTQESLLKRQEQMPEEYTRSHQRKQIWLLLSMLVRQNGSLSGADLSELLLSNNETEFESEDESTEIGKLRRYLMLGQKKTALEHSAKSGLWGHAFALTYFTSPRDGQQLNLMQMSSMISKFINSTLSRDDPIFILFRCLLQKSENKTINKLVPTSNLQQFAILLANDCEVSPAISNSAQSSELLKFIVALRSTSSQALVNLNNLDVDFENEDRALKFAYSDELVFVNEIWEFARNINDFIESLVPLKLIFAARLFDYGLINQASRYCYVLRQYHAYYDYYFQGKSLKDSSIKWDVIMDVVNDMECRIYGFDVTGDSKNKEKAEEENKEKDGEDDANSTSSESQEDDEGNSGKKNGSDANVSAIKPAVQSRNVQSVTSSDIGKPVQTSSTLNPPPNNQHSEASKKEPGISNVSVSGSRTNSKKPTRSKVSSNDVKKQNTNASGTPSEMNAEPKDTATFPTISETQHNNNPGPPKAAQPNLFIPAPLPTQNEPAEFNFISSAPTLFTAPSNLGQQQQQQVKGDAVDGEIASGSAVHLSAGQSYDNRPFNSTAMPSNPTGAFPSPFSPINSPEPEENPSYGQDSLSNASHSLANGPADSSDPAEKDKNGGQKAASASDGGWFSGFTSKIKSVIPAGPKQAVLPDDKNPTIYYDEQLKRWVDKNDPQEAEALDAIAKGPPKMPLAIGSRPPPGLSANQQAGQLPLGQSGPPPANLSANSLPSLPSPGSSNLPALPSAAGNLPSANGGNSFSFVKSSASRRRHQYVDVFQQPKTAATS
ncbi:Protein transport protein Sec16B [Halotydeus destructor]|nr:Protein transport protein Sec16B [Halotydeus destructor]